MELCLMVEGQEGLSWKGWIRLAEACEEHGFAGFFRSDHYSAFHSQRQGAHDAWATINALAAVTERVRLGTLVSPVTFRHPSILARMVAGASEISGGRVELGIGIGWNEAEHVQGGFDYPPAPERLRMLEEQLEILRLSWSPEPFDFAGDIYTLRGANPHPKPVGAVNVIVGGAARPGTVRAAVAHADEYNTSGTPMQVAERAALIAEACQAAGRAPLRISVIAAQCVIGENRVELERRLTRLEERTGAPRGHSQAVTIQATVDGFVEALSQYEAAGVHRVMLQHILDDDLEMVRLLGEAVLPRFPAASDGH